MCVFTREDFFGLSIDAASAGFASFVGFIAVLFTATVFSFATLSVELDLLASARALLGRLPTNEEYQAQVAGLKPLADDIYRYLNFNEIAEYQKEAVKGLQMIKDIPVVTI